MCGIGGCVGEHADTQLMKKMSALIHHRGPDEYGDFIDRGVGVFCNRLSIIDLAGGRQPITNETGDLVIVYNGETYNFPELRDDLEKKGHKFKTNSDTEVILHGFEEYDHEIFGMLDGMFGLAIWDLKAKRLVLARDRVGVKPLYYTITADGELVFCSEVKGILAHPKVKPEVNTQALYDLISLYYVPFEQTLFKGIFKLLPGHYYDSSTKMSLAYWTPPPIRDNYVPDIDTVRNALEQSVERQLISDVEVGSFLSGGLDTSTIVAFASKHYQGRLKTFCMGFGHDDDEIPDARRVAEHYGTDHHELIISDKSALELYPSMIWHSEEPRVNTYSWFINQYASKFVKVCLSGLGGDELFFGYPTSSRFLSFQRAQSLMKIPGISALGLFTSGKKRTVISNVKNRPYIYLTTVSPVFGTLDSEVFRMPVNGDRIELTKRMDEEFFQRNHQDFVQQAVRAEFRTKLPDHFLMIDDTMSMAHSLENRVPLLDNQLLDLILPVSYKHSYEKGTGKLLLRKAVNGILPESCLTKSKQGFSLDVLKWWKGELGEEIRKTIPESVAVNTYFEVGKLKSLISRAGESYSTASLLWYVYAFHVWYDLYIENVVTNLQNRTVEKAVAA